MLLENATAMLFENHQQGSYRPRMATRRRKLTSDELADAARLRNAWEVKKRTGMTQEAVSAKCGWESQSAFSQYLNGVIPLNLEAALRIARALDVGIADLSPRFAALLPATNLSPKALAFAQLYEDCPQEGRAELLRMVTKWVKAEVVDSEQRTRA
jgi:transcriptional regulator with XRE-family HTH domain